MKAACGWWSPRWWSVSRHYLGQPFAAPLIVSLAFCSFFFFLEWNCFLNDFGSSVRCVCFFFAYIYGFPSKKSPSSPPPLPLWKKPPNKAKTKPSQNYASHPLLQVQKHNCNFSKVIWKTNSRLKIMRYCSSHPQREVLIININRPFPVPEHSIIWQTVNLSSVQQSSLVMGR